MTFQELGLIDPILKALQAQGYSEPTPIQRGAIPPALKGRDVLGCAQTGTGKTCAFAAPILQRLNGKNGNPRTVKALVLTPTRELALQIGESFRDYGRGLSLRCAVIFGGVGQNPQVEALSRGVDILVATPGRLLDLSGQGLVDLSRIEIFVLDEADRMLDMGFIHDVRRVLKLLPEKKQTLFFSATMPPEVMELVNSLLHNYARVAVDPVSSPVEVIDQSLYYVDKGNKIKLLAHLLDTLDVPSALVFSRTKHGANRIARDLEKLGVSAAAIHGNKSQTARVQALGDFKAGRLRVLAATDIAARGLDIQDLPYVFNYDLPDVPETYVHRIGRTGRAGRGGRAISFCHYNERDELRAIEKLLGRSLPVVEDHPYPMVDLSPPMKDKHGKIINAEDQEARQAAREKRQRERETQQAQAQAAPEKKKRSVKQREAQAKQEQQAARRETQEPQKPERRQGAAQGARDRQAPEARQEEARSAAPRYDRPSARGVRQGRLEDTLPKSPAMPATDFVKPDPLASDVIMDATARLLSSRRGGRIPPQPAREKPPRQKSGKGNGPERREQGQKQEREQTRAQGLGQPGQKQNRAQRRGGGKPENAYGDPGRRQAGGRGKRPAKDAPRAERAPHSLMRPYYIEHDD